MRLTIFKASDAPIALIVCCFEVDGKLRWQLIKWSMGKTTVEDKGKKKTVIADNFIEGQWLINKQLCLHSCAISSDGQYFYWIYNRYQSRDEHVTNSGISKLPNFTAIMYGKRNIYDGLGCRFDKETGKPINNHGLYPKDTTEIICVSKGTPAHSGLMMYYKNWIDDFGRIITVDGYKLSANGVVIYDATDNTFKKMKPI